MKTTGQILAETLRTNFGIGTRTRRVRKGINMITGMIEAIENATCYPGYYSEEKTEVFRSAWGAVLSHGKHYDGCRIDPALRRKISEMTPWQFANLLGQMVDAGVTNTGEGERFYAAMARAL